MPKIAKKAGPNSSIRFETVKQRDEFLDRLQGKPMNRWFNEQVNEFIGNGSMRSKNRELEDELDKKAKKLRDVEMAHTLLLDQIHKHNEDVKQYILNIAQCESWEDASQILLQYYKDKSFMLEVDG